MILTDKELNQDLSILNDKSIVLPLGEVKISRKITSVLILFRTNSNVEIWDQNKKRLFEKPKVEYTLRSLNSLIKSIKFFIFAVIKGRTGCTSSDNYIFNILLMRQFFH